MKAKLAILALAAVFTATSNAATLQLTTGLTTATILRNSAGQPLGDAAWGILVDTTGNGFTNFSGTTLVGTAIQSGFLGGSDDYFFLAATNTLAAGPLLGGATQAIVDYGANAAVDGGKSYSIIWFEGTARGATLSDGSTYGMSPATATLPASNGDTVSPTAFHGANGNSDRLIGVPEPSVAILGALGVLGLVRRRR